MPVLIKGDFPAVFQKMPPTLKHKEPHTHLTLILECSVIFSDRRPLLSQNFPFISLHLSKTYLEKNLQKSLGFFGFKFCHRPRYAWDFSNPLSYLDATQSLQKAHVWNSGLQLGSVNLLEKHFLQNKHNSNNPLHLPRKCFSSSQQSLSSHQ